MSQPVADTNDIEKWFTPGRFAVALFLLLCACFPDVILGRTTFYLRDYAVFSYPLAHYQRECFWQGQLPLWTPLSYCGTPFLAQWNTMCLYPPDLFYLLLPLSWALGVFCLGHLWFGGLGMYYLVRRWTGNGVAAAAGGVMFAFSAVMLNFLMWPPNVAALAWMPWVVLAMERAWREGGRFLWLAALAGAMQMLACVPEIVLQTWVLLAAMAVFGCVRERNGRWRRAGRFLLPAILVAGLASAQLLPFLDLVAHSQRDTGFGISKGAMPAWGWANYLVPLFRMEYSRLGVYTQPGQPWICSYYPGIGTAVLAVLAAWHIRSGRVRLLAGLTLLCLVLALGPAGGLYSWLRKLVPLLGLMRYPVKFIVLPAFLVPLLAAIFLGHCRTCPLEEWTRLRRRILWTGGAVLVAVGLIVWAAFLFPLENTSPGDAARSGLSRSVGLACLLAAVLQMRNGRRVARVASLAGLLVLLWLDVPTAGPSLAPTVDRSVYQPGLVQQEMKLTAPPRIGESRLRLDVPAQAALNVPALTNAVEHVLYNRLGESGNLNLLDDIPTVTGFLPLVPQELNNISVILYRAPELPSGLADFLAISHVNVPGRVTEWMFRPTHLPWVTGGQGPVFATEEETLAVLAGPDFNPRTTVYLPREAAAGLAVTNSSAPEIQVRQFTAQQVRVAVQAAEPALVVIAQTYYHNWRAFVDGKPVPLLRANHAFQAVAVPAGRHEVRLIYRDRNFELGAGISLGSLVICAVGLWRTRRREVTVSSTPS